MSASISRYLKDFTPEPPLAQSVMMDDIDGDLDSLDLLPMPLEPAVDLDAERRVAYAEGYEAAQSELTEKHATEMQAVADHFAKEMAELKARYETELAAHLAAAVNTFGDSLTRVMDSAVTELLVPIMRDKVNSELVMTFAEQVTNEILTGEATKISISGTERFIDEVKERLGDKAEMIAFRETDGPDLVVELDDTLLTARLGRFVEALEGGLHE